MKDKMMDHSYDYLLPTCMLKRRSVMKSEHVAIEPIATSFYTDTIFDDTFKALDDDTCSEISDRSYADASYYTRMKLWKSPYLERQFYSDSEDVSHITKDPPKSSSQFDLSLQQFLEWPDSSGGQDSDVDTALSETYHNGATRTRRKSTEKRKRAPRMHSFPRNLTPQKRTPLPKVVIESDSDFSPQSEEEDVFKDYDLTGDKTVLSSTIENAPTSKESVKNTRLSLKSYKSIDSDSDYRTYSDTSSERLDTNFATRASDSHKVVDLTSLKSLMSSVLKKSENISSKLQQSRLNNEFRTKTGILTQDVNFLKSNSTNISSVERKGGELEHFKHLLEKAQDMLTQSETAVESLQQQLQDEKFLCKEKKEAETEINRLQEEVASLQGKLEKKAKECDNKCVELETVARQLDVVNSHNGKRKSDLLDEILAEIKLLQSINAAVNPSYLSTVSSSHKHGKTNSNCRQNSLSTELNDDINPSDQPSDLDGDSNGSHVEMSDALPVLPDNICATSDTDSIQQIATLTAQMNDLKRTLTATEETVHCQTHKMKHYRNILLENGLLTVSRSRSNSVPSRNNTICKTQSSESNSKVQRRYSADNHYHHRRRSVSPTLLSRRQLNSYNVLESAETMEKLLKENSKLKQQISGYRRVLRVFQGKNRLSGSDSDTGVDWEVSPLGAESAQCFLECWIGMVDKFLSDLCQSEEDDLLHHSAAFIDVTRIKKGLMEAKEAVQTLSESCIAAEEKCSEDRLSEDSGCSDIFASAQKTVKDCQFNNGEDSHSPFESHRLGPQTDTDRLMVDNESDAKSTYENGTGSRLSHRSNHGSWLTVCMSDRQHETGSWTDNYHKHSNSFSDHVCCETEKNSSSSSGYSKDIVECTSRDKGSLVVCELNRSELYDPDICVPDSDKDNNYGTQACGCSDFNHDCKKIDITISNHSQRENETDINKSRRCANRSVKDLQNEGECIEASTRELHNRMKSFEKVIRSYEEQIRKHFRPDIASVQEHLKGLGDLRVMLEKHMNHNEVLEKVLQDLTKSSEGTIQELKQQLSQCNSIIQQKTAIISVRDAAIKESNVNLEKYRDNSSKTSAELDLCRKRVASLEMELKAAKDRVDQLTTKCQQLETKVDHCNKQYEEDKENPLENVYRFEAIPPGSAPESDVEMNTVTDIPDLKARMNELEIVALQWSQNESKYKSMLSQSTSEVKKLSADLDTAREELKQKNYEMEYLKAELEGSRDTIEEQSLHVCDKTRVIDRLKCELQKQNMILHEQDALCRELTSKLEELNTANEKLSTQLELDKHRSNEYTQKNYKQNQLIQDLKDRIAKLKAELTLSVQMRNSLDKLMVREKKDTFEAMKLKDKYLYNLKVTYRELSKTKKNLKDEHRKLEEISSINRSLQSEVKVRARLMDKKGDMLTDDEKQNMITDLLHELQHLREQVTTILEQNKNMKAKLTLYYQRYKGKTQRQSTNGRSMFYAENVDTLKKLQEETNKCNAAIHGVSTEGSEQMHQDVTVNEPGTFNEKIHPAMTDLPLITISMVST